MADELPPTAAAAAAPYAVPVVQLTQVRVPLPDAADAFAVPDAAGRFPILVLTGERSRIRNGFVLAGVGLLAAGLIFSLGPLARGALLVGGALSLFIGVFQSFVVRVPEGSQALALRAGRFSRAIPAGVHVLPPWIAVTHVVTKREIPFVVPGAQVPTSDGVRVDIDLLITFAIDSADRFVFSISAPDFDQVCRAASQDALRRLTRGVGSGDVLDLAGAESDSLREAIGAALADYGVIVHKVVVMAVRPPQQYMASLEARRLAEVHQAEQTERYALERRRQADRMDLERHQAEGRRKLIELEATNESLRLERLQARIGAFPDAARWDYDSQKMDVARALAGNDRAFLAVGDPTRLTDALLVADRDDAASPPTGPPEAAAAKSSPRRGRRPTGG